MDFRHFRYFVTVAEELHFARAAEQLGIAQPALSQQIKSLEERLGARLLNRTKRRIELTEAGTAFLTEARAALAQAEKAIRIAKDTARGESGTLNIGFVGSAMYDPRFPHMLKDYRSAHPGISLLLHEMPIAAQIESVDNGHLDIAIVRAPLPAILSDNLETFVLATQVLIAVLSHDHALAKREKIALHELANDNFVAFHDPDGVGLGHALLEECQQAGFDPLITLRVTEVATLISLAAAGLGVTLIPDSIAHLQLPGVKYIPLEGEARHTKLIVIHRRFERSAAVQALLRKIRESV